MSTNNNKVPRVQVNEKALKAKAAKETPALFIEFLEETHQAAAGLDKLHWEHWLAFEYSHNEQYEKANEVLLRHIKNLQAAPPAEVANYYDLAASSKKYYDSQTSTPSPENLVIGHCHHLQVRRAMNLHNAGKRSEAQRLCNELEPHNIGKGLEAPAGSLQRYLALDIELSNRRSVPPRVQKVDSQEK